MVMSKLGGSGRGGGGGSADGRPESSHCRELREVNGESEEETGESSVERNRDERCRCILPYLLGGAES